MNNNMKINNNKTSQEYKIIGYYEKLAAETKMLKRADEFELLKKAINDKCETSRAKLISAYLKIVVSLSRKYVKNNNLSRADFIHEGISGIHQAIDSFKLEKYKVVNKDGGGLFGFWCYRMILKYLWNFYRLNIRQFGISDFSNSRLNNINKLYKQGKFTNLNEKDIIDYVSKTLKLKKSETKLLLNLFKPAAELDKPVDLEEGEFTAGDLLSFNPPDRDNQDIILNSSFDHTPISYIEEKERFDNLLKSLDELPEVDRALIHYRYGINCQKHTLSKLAKKYNISPAKINSKLDKIHGRLKSLVESKN